MADDVTYTAGANATPPDATKAATDETTAGPHSAGSHMGIAKLAVSADGDSTHIPATAADGLLVEVSNAAIPVSGTVSVTEPVSVDDNGGSLTVDAPLATPVHTRISDGTDAVNVSAAGALQVDGSAVTQPVSAAALPLPAGAATSALQLPDGHNVTVDNAAGGAAVNIQDGGNSLTVDGTVGVSGTVTVDGSGVTQPVSNAGLTALNGAIAGTEVQVDVVGALPAGTNNIGDVDIASLPNEGQQSMANSISVAVASDQSDLPTKEKRSGTATTTQVSDNAASTQLLASNANRLGATIENDSSAALYVKLGTTASTTDYTVRLIQYAYYEVPFNYTGRIDGIWASDPGDGAARITELT